MRPTILIVDDCENIRFTLKEICSYANWDVIEASTGKEAVDIFHVMEPDVILIDYHMPEWDGLRTTKEIRKLNEHVPIIILTVDDRQKIADKFIKEGATDFALKPIKAPDLISRIRVNLKIGQLTKKDNNVFVEKGINEKTLRSIKLFLIKQDKPVTIDDMVEKLPVSYQTINRYLNYLEAEGMLQVIPEYGRTGRPKNWYRLQITQIS